MNDACVLALGFFDGVHLGHGGLLSRTRELADRLGLPAAALSFDTHPDELVFGTPVPLINSSSDREWLMHRYYGIDRVFFLHFDRETMCQPWRDFVTQTVLGKYHAAHVVCGHDFRFGDRGLGTPERLAEVCHAHGAGCDCIPEIRIDGQTVSSTLIRKLLSEGEMQRAVRFLGHPHILTGTVVSGQKLGRTIGIPTANLRLPEGVLTPRFGVYAAKACFEDQSLPAVVNIGVRPTVSGSGVTVEPWILDYEGDLYGKALRLEFYAFLRPEQKFPSLAALRQEVLRNAAQTRAFFSGSSES